VSDWIDRMNAAGIPVHRPTPRYRSGWSMTELYPYRTDGMCRCGCGEPITPPKRVWASKECQSKAVRHYRILKGDGGEIRRAVYERDHGICAHCGLEKPWEAHHKLPVHRGGAGCDLDGFETLCIECHDEEHRPANHPRPERSPTARTL
jgi:5-methylcytosine-specific restriction endonuclease McrA